MKFPFQNVIVTGGAGAIGSALSRRLLAEGAKKVTIIDDCSSGFVENLPVDPRVTFLRGSITDEAILEQAFAGGCDVVFHLAAHFANQNSVEHPVLDLQTNGEGTLKLLEAARTAGIKKFVYASSSCVYGNQTGPLNESQVLLQLDTPYAISKLVGEQYAIFYNHFHKLPVVVLRYFNSFGPSEYPGRYRNVIPNFIARALEGSPLVITGTGAETRDFTYIDNTIEGTVLAATNPNSAGKIYNIGGGREISILELAEKINAATGNTAPIEFKPRRAWDTVARRCADITLAQKELGYNPKDDFTNQLATTIAWFKTLPAAVRSNHT